MTLVGVAVGGVLAVVAVFIPWLPEPAAEQADTDDGSPIHGHTGLEIAWTIIPAVLVTVIAVYSGIALAQAEDLPSGRRIVEIKAQQFAWLFTYPDIKLQNNRALTTGELVLPVGRPAEFHIESVDVIHSFWVPEFRMKQDAVQGITTRTFVTPTRRGTYPVICTELCGLGHPTMRARVRVVSSGEFEAWVAEQKRLAQEAGSVQGKELFAQNCGSCHVLADAGTQGQVGPNLDNVLKGKSADFIRESIVDPDAEIAQGFQPGVMPKNFEQLFTPQQLDGLVEYLAQASGGSR
jgi:cytochrome c oxidase subunit 2